MGILTAVGIAPAANSAGSRTSISVPVGGCPFVRDFICRRLVGGRGKEVREGGGGEGYRFIIVEFRALRLCSGRGGGGGGGGGGGVFL